MLAEEKCGFYLRVEHEYDKNERKEEKIYEKYCVAGKIVWAESEYKCTMEKGRCCGRMYIACYIILTFLKYFIYLYRFIERRFIHIEHFFILFFSSLLIHCFFYFLRWIGNSLSLVPFIFISQQMSVFFLLIFKSCSLLLTLNNIFRWMNNHLNYYVNEWSIFFIFTWTDSHIVFSNQ